MLLPPTLTTQAIDNMRPDSNYPFHTATSQTTEHEETLSFESANQDHPMYVMMRPHDSIQR
jgi:hypothetical protein